MDVTRADAMLREVLIFLDERGPTIAGCYVQMALDAFDMDDLNRAGVAPAQGLGRDG
ncbi:hypothetical protein [Sphingomonas nostoxanthinifaciens]|uniref:hypothetical protein n=1 Tax=Sphingomonas nostoxanthinifaciens TaxID=2872652 RepID=UPI001CC1E051|nr:hypothetical protein [Sphingomonas nostoxanthinifaciens]UAK25521.1 hypothetical protein K8P63_04985 [Sphingomonas nostoxanthinifaciens]